MRIQPIVEGHGEQDAVPVLLRRFRDEAGAFSVDVNPAIRRKRHELVTEDLLRKAIRLALLQPECCAVFIIFDSDDDCPRELAPTILKWAEEESRGTPCAVVLANHEYEAWFLAAVESLRGIRGIRGDAASHDDPERPRGAKELINDRLIPGRSYSEKADQPAFTAEFDMRQAYRRCPSFRHCVTAFRGLLLRMGVGPAEWPPPQWEGRR